jgi:hypothetical protein
VLNPLRIESVTDRGERGGGRPGSNIVSSLPAPSLRRARRRPKFARSQAFVLHNPRSTGPGGVRTSSYHLHLKCR